MSRSIIATVAAAAIALTTFSAAPARALDSGELGRLILGTGAVLLLGAAINEHSRKRNNVVVKRQPTYRNTNTVVVPSYCVHGHGHNRWVDWGCVKRSGY